MNDRLIQRRKVPRRAFVRDVGLLVNDKYVVSQAVQIGEGGMMILSPMVLQKEQQIVVTFFLPDGHAASIRSTVKYNMKGEDSRELKRYGIQFETAGFDCKRHIRNFVAAKTVQEAQEEKSDDKDPFKNPEWSKPQPQAQPAMAKKGFTRAV